MREKNIFDILVPSDL